MGGKSYIADWIVSYFPRHITYVEVFGGAASVLFNKPRSKVEVYNDLWGDVVCLFEVLRDESNGLINFLELTPCSREIYYKFQEKWIKRRFSSRVERAGVIFYLLCISRNSKVFTDFPIRKARSSARKYCFHKERIPKFAKRLKDVVIENLDFREVIPKYDSEETLFYCDPPYYGVEHYVFSFTYRDHYELSKLLNSIEGKAVVSYYPNREIEQLYNSWFRVEKVVPKYSSVTSGKREFVTELLLMNYKPKKVSLMKAKPLGEIFS